MTATGWACQFRAPRERPESTHSGRSLPSTATPAHAPFRTSVNSAQIDRVSGKRTFEPAGAGDAGSC